MAGSWPVQARWVPSHHYVKRADGVIWMLTMYPKNVTESIPANVLRKIREEIENA